MRIRIPSRVPRHEPTHEVRRDAENRSALILFGVENSWRTPWAQLRADSTPLFGVSREALVRRDEPLRH